MNHVSLIAPSSKQNTQKVSFFERKSDAAWQKMVICTCLSYTKCTYLTYKGICAEIRLFFPIDLVIFGENEIFNFPRKAGNLRQYYGSVYAYNLALPTLTTVSRASSCSYALFSVLVPSLSTVLNFFTFVGKSEICGNTTGPFTLISSRFLH